MFGAGGGTVARQWCKPMYQSMDRYEAKLKIGGRKLELAENEKKNCDNMLNQIDRKELWIKYGQNFLVRGNNGRWN